MTLNEVSEKFHVSADRLREYEAKATLLACIAMMFWNTMIR